MAAPSYWYSTARSKIYVYKENAPLSVIVVEVQNSVHVILTEIYVYKENAPLSVIVVEVQNSVQVISTAFQRQLGFKEKVQNDGHLEVRKETHGDSTTFMWSEVLCDNYDYND